MTLEQVYFISQITAAVVLISSIIFLALQVRQNSKVIQRSMMEDHRTAQNTVAQRVYEDREFAEFHMRSRESYDELDEVDKYRSEWLAIWRLRRILRVIQARLDGLVSDVDWGEIQSGVRVGSKRAHIQVIWERMKNDYPRPVQDVYDELANS